MPATRRRLLRAAAPAALPLLLGTQLAANDGRCADGAAVQQGPSTELAPGVREVFVTKTEVELGRYRWLWLTDLVLEPGAELAEAEAPNDRIYLVTHGMVRLRVGGRDHLAKPPHHLWAVAAGTPTWHRNPGTDPAVIRVIDLLAFT
jgi:hypothetical protein